MLSGGDRRFPYRVNKGREGDGGVSGRMAETKRILVAGATGQQGGAVARRLVKLGHRVRGVGAAGDLGRRVESGPTLTMA